jgi:hypothetical protein
MSNRKSTHPEALLVVFFWIFCVVLKVVLFIISEGFNAKPFLKTSEQPISERIGNLHVGYFI